MQVVCDISKLHVLGETSADLLGRVLLAVKELELGVTVRRSERILLDSLPRQVIVEAPDTGPHSLGNDTVGVGADHDVCLDNVLPHREPAALLEVLEHRVDHAGNALGGDKELPGGRGAERVPDRVARV